MTATGTGGGSKSLILTPMIFAVAMTFIDQTIVSIAAVTARSSGLAAARDCEVLTGGDSTAGSRKLVSVTCPAAS